ncbi:Sporulation initiation inhibitor protein Soj [Stutzerimonas frequens]|uniref:AAA family ATPase n=1 Tax=Stutzerimonas frequens TaxID=2968969 RepID=UPI001268C1D5|nr:AAA family ATPase [Stutzerimonas frequens]QFU12016.1 Sporulation initiation inhibitor protein Soj [Stutzerimonas frequens]|tara:strand:- start:3260 stop:4477 length:1218 start_codon:yes stop_codon:yes gene_type:complete
MLNTLEKPSSVTVGGPGLRLLVSSRDAGALTRLKTLAQQLPGLQVSTRLVSNGHTDPLYGLEQMPDLLLLHVSHLWREELAALQQHPLQQRPPLLVCGPQDDRDCMRMAMQASARDFLPEPLVEQELLAAISRIALEARDGHGSGGKVIAIMNAKGGSGATMLACNLTHSLSAYGRRTLLLDLDLQFGTVAHCLDVRPSHSHMEVLQRIDELDSVALHGFCSHFSPTLDVLGGRASELCLTQDIQLEQVEALLRLARSSYEWVVVDLPRQIDHLTGITLEQADQVYVVLQQSLSHLKDAVRLVRIMREDLGIRGDRLQLVVNRYDKTAPVSLKDIAEALHCGVPQRLPNDYAVINESQNTGVPLGLHAPRAPLTQGIRQMAQELLGKDTAEQGLLKRTFGRLFGG